MNYAESAIAASTRAIRWLLSGACRSWGGLVVLAKCFAGRLGRSTRLEERGQATAEYALVILGAAALAMLFVAWATDTKRIGSFFNAVMRSLKDLVT